MFVEKFKCSFAPPHWEAMQKNTSLRNQSLDFFPSGSNKGGKLLFLLFLLVQRALLVIMEPRYLASLTTKMPSKQQKKIRTQQKKGIINGTEISRNF